MDNSNYEYNGRKRRYKNFRAFTWSEWESVALT
nr:MAG TPA: hypothetical protein [Caudoviricetes sp.]